MQSPITPRTAATPAEAALIIVICFGWAILSSTLSAMGDAPNVAFTDEALLGLMSMELTCAATALFVLYFRGYSLSSLYPRPTLVGIGLGVALYVASVLASWIVVAPFAVGQASEPIDAMLSEASLSPGALVAAAFVNGAYEEIFLLGFLVQGLRGYGVAVAVGVSLLVRVLYHTYQGPLGAISVLAFGLVITLFYIKTNSLFPVVFAHVIGDIVPFLVTGTV